MSIGISESLALRMQLGVICRIYACAAVIGVASCGIAAAATVAAASPKPSHHTAHAFVGRNRQQSRVIHARTSAATCSAGRTAVAPIGGAMGPNGPSGSQTLLAVPLGGGTAADATRWQQIAEACTHVRR